MNKILFFLFLVIVSAESYSQFDKELLSINYTYAPTGNDDHDFSKIDMRFGLPIKLKNGFLRNSVNFNYFKTNFEDDISFNTTDLEQVYGINYGLMYTHNLSDKWGLNLRGGVSLTSNLTDKISGDDLQFIGGVTAVKRGGTFDKPSKFVFGLGYATITGKPRVIPLVSFTKRINDKFSYGIGFPRTYALYKVNEKSTLKGMLWMNGYYSNLSDPVDIGYNVDAEKSSFSAIALGLDYSYRLNKLWSIVFKGGYSLKSKYDLLDSENEIIYNFDSSAKPYFSTGVKINLNRNFIRNRGK